jgi:hypothetical protein
MIIWSCSTKTIYYGTSQHTLPTIMMCALTVSLGKDTPHTCQIDRFLRELLERQAERVSGDEGIPIGS